MANIMHVTIASPERRLFDDEVLQFSCPTPEGEITILPHHAPLVSSLAEGQASCVLPDGTIVFFHIDGGFVEVAAGGAVTLLADAASHATELDEAAIQEAYRRAQEQTKRANLSDEEYVTAFISLEKSLSRIHTMRKHFRHHRTSISGESMTE